VGSARGSGWRRRSGHHTSRAWRRSRSARPTNVGSSEAVLGVEEEALKKLVKSLKMDVVIFLFEVNGFKNITNG
jgi:hypothetical protein